MTDVSQASKQSSPSGEGFDLAKLLLEGRAFFALIVIIVVFSILSPYYLSVANFLTMARMSPSSGFSPSACCWSSSMAASTCRSDRHWGLPASSPVF